MMSTANHLMEQRLCVATLMDAHAQTFGHPAAGGTWLEFVQSGADPVGADRRAVDRALGTISALFRSAQMALGDVPTPGQFFAADQSGAINRVATDRLAMELAGQDAEDDPESVAFARAITLYKHACANGLVQAQTLAEHMDVALDEQPANTPLARDAKLAARRMVAIEIKNLMSTSVEAAS